MEITIQDCSYYVEMAGEGPPLLLLHGFTGSGATWRETVNMLKDCFCCVTVDILGHGRSAAPKEAERYRIQLVAQDMKELMKELGHSRFHLLGYSMGGRLALTIAVMFPEAVQSLILESASPGLRTEEERSMRRQSDEELAERIEREGIESFINYWENIPLFETQKQLSKDRQQAIREERLQNKAAGLSGSLRGMGTGAQPSWWPLLPQLRMPVLLVTGSKDQKFAGIANEMQELLSVSAWKEINAAGHAIHVEECRKFGTIVKEFLLHTL